MLFKRSVVKASYLPVFGWRKNSLSVDPDLSISDTSKPSRWRLNFLSLNVPVRSKCFTRRMNSGLKKISHGLDYFDITPKNWAAVLLSPAPYHFQGFFQGKTEKSTFTQVPGKGRKLLFDALGQFSQIKVTVGIMNCGHASPTFGARDLWSNLNINEKDNIFSALIKRLLRHLPVHRRRRHLWGVSCLRLWLRLRLWKRSLPSIWRCHQHGLWSKGTQTCPSRACHRCNRHLCVIHKL